MMWIHPDDRPAILEKLRIKARADYNARIPVNPLDEEHRRVLIRAINNVLSTEEAILTYAQIIDGLPTADVAWDRRIPGLYGEHPLEEHEELCPGALDKAREVCPQWTIEMLSFDPKPVHAFQDAAPGTKMFNTRLIEMVAVSLHQFAVLLHQLEFRLHKGKDIDAVTNWMEPTPDYAAKFENWQPWKPPPTIFNHPFYLDHDIYPDGIADMVGYWAEDHILGGVVVFDRRAELDEHGEFIMTQEQQENLPNIYLHPCRNKVTMLVTQLLDHQQQALIDFLLAADSATAKTSCPLPILVDDRNRVRYKNEDAIIFHRIYRDVWERSPIDKEERKREGRRPQSTLDYPGVLLTMLNINLVTGDPLPEKQRRYLDGEEDINDDDYNDGGAWRRALDEFKERFGWEKKNRDMKMLPKGSSWIKIRGKKGRNWMVKM